MKISKLIVSLLFSLALSSVVFAEDGTKGGEKGGEDFRKAASEYQAQAAKYKDKGKSEIASLYTRLAEIKSNAAGLADQGRWDDIDWTEYHKVNEKIAKLEHHK